MKGRIGPNKGYCFESKNEYRSRVWATFCDFLKRRNIPRSEAQVLFLPSKEGLEIDLAHGLGFRYENMHIVDFNPAIVASLNRKFANKLNAYGVDLAQAGKRIARQSIDCANLDLTGKISKKTLLTTHAFINSGCLSSVSCVGFTVLRGREFGLARGVLNDPLLSVLQKNGVARLMRGLSKEDIRRITFFSLAVSHGGPDGFYGDSGSEGTWVGRLVIPFLGGSYKSIAGSQTMLFFLSRVICHEVFNFAEIRKKQIKCADLRRLHAAKVLGLSPHELDTFLQCFNRGRARALAGRHGLKKRVAMRHETKMGDTKEMRRRLVSEMGRQ